MQPVEFLKQLVIPGSRTSSMRWVFIWTYLFATVVPITAWAVMYLKTDGKADIGSGIVSLASLIVGAVTAGKVFQKKEEVKGAPNVRTSGES